MNRIQELEGARGLLALWVLVYHVFAITDVHVPAALDGANAVAVFFALSGFVIALLLSRRRERYGVFVVRRWFRLFPAFAVTVLVGAVLSYVGVMPDRTAPGTDGLHALAHLTMLHGLVPDGLLSGASGSFLNPAWSISVEWQFYLVAPFFFWAVVRRPLVAWGALFVVAAFTKRALGGFETNGMPLFGGASLVSNAALFTFGIVSFAVFTWVAEHRDALSGRGSLIAVALPLIPLFVMPIGPNVGVLVWLALLGVTLAVLVDGGNSAAPVRWLSAVLASPAVVWLGTVSYSLYLGHEPLVWLIKAGIESFGIEGWLLTALVGMLSIPASIACAALLYRWVEIPGIMLGKRYGRESKVRADDSSEVVISRQASP